MERSQSDDSLGPGAAWHEPSVEQSTLEQYLRALREGVWLVAAVTAICLAAAGVYVVLTPTMYTAETDVLVTPVSGGDPSMAGIGVIAESADPTQTAQTVAQLIESTAVAEAVTREMNLRETPQELLRRVQARPVAGSSIVAISAEGSTPAAAKELSDTYARTAVRVRAVELDAKIDVVISNLRKQVAGAEGTGRQALEQEIAQLEAIKASDSAGFQVATPAALPTGPSQPRTVASLVAGLLAGLVLGVAAAFVWQAVDPRLRREEQIRHLFRLPILARVPDEPHGVPDRPLDPLSLSASTLEAYRGLRATLAAFGGASDSGRSILLTGASPREGKSTTALGLAYALALGGQSVVIVEADLRRPTLRRGLGLGGKTEAGTKSVLLGQASLESALVAVPKLGPSVRALLADESGEGMDELLSLPATGSLLAEARSLADYVVIDSPPLAEVIDALSLARHVDDVVLVARLGHTRIAKLDQLGEVLHRHGVTPVGIVLVGAGRAGRTSYYAGG